MKQQRLFRMLFFVLVAVMMLYDLFFNNLSALISRGGLAYTATDFDITLAQAQQRLIIQSILSATAGVGALMAAQGYQNPTWRIGLPGVYIATLGLIAYGLFNIASGLWIIQSILRTPVMLTGGTYLVLAGGTWYAGKGLREGRP